LLKINSAKENKKFDPTTKRILVVDDESFIVDIIRRALERSHYQVDIAYDGETALKELESRDYDLIIIDIKMPGISGIEVYHRISKNKPELAERFLFLTGNTIGSETIDFLNQTGNFYLAKPFTIANLLEVVKSAIEKLSA